MVRIALDPGHGCAPAPTGTAAGGMNERDYVLEFARDLIARAPRWRFRLLRSKKTGATYGDRAVTAAEWRADLVICLHVNSYINDQLAGMICMYDRADLMGREVAKAIARAAPSRLLREDPMTFPVSPLNWTRRANGIVRQYRAAGLSCVLSELGFASNPADVAVLTSPRSRDAMCAAHIAGIARAVEMLPE